MSPLPPPPLLAFLARALRTSKLWLPGPEAAWDAGWRSQLPKGLAPMALPDDGVPPAGVSLALLAEGADAATAMSAGVALFLLPATATPAAGKGAGARRPAMQSSTGGSAPGGAAARPSGPTDETVLDEVPANRPSPSPLVPVLAPLRLAAGGLWLAGSCRAGLSAAANKGLGRLAEQEGAKASLELLPPEVGALVHVLAAARVSRRALELGAGAGASSLWLASALAATGGSLIAIEKDTARVNLAQRALRAAELSKRVELRIGEVERLAPKLGRGIDLLLMDEGLEDRAERLDLLLSLGVLAQGALVVAHGGRQDPGRDAAFQARLQLDTRIAARLRLNMGSGVTVGVVA
ncbi:MAG TPA: class I SAM-dependent methyltransferase [Anaerolineae bacterium]|nr:class I SAM-dependent methyltransferase [Anaerolineae bacterium]